MSVATEVVKCEGTILKIMAIIFLNLLAFIYDGQYVPVALGIDALTLGFSLKSVTDNKVRV